MKIIAAILLLLLGFPLFLFAEDQQMAIFKKAQLLAQRVYEECSKDEQSTACQNLTRELQQLDQEASDLDNPPKNKP